MDTWRRSMLGMRTFQLKSDVCSFILVLEIIYGHKISGGHNFTNFQSNISITAIL